MNRAVLHPMLPSYAADARRTVGVEPDPKLLAQARQRTRTLPNVEVTRGSAENLPLPDVLVDRFLADAEPSETISYGFTLYVAYKPLGEPCS